MHSIAEAYRNQDLHLVVPHRCKLTNSLCVIISKVQKQVEKYAEAACQINYRVGLGKAVADVGNLHTLIVQAGISIQTKRQ